VHVGPALWGPKICPTLVFFKVFLGEEGALLEYLHAGPLQPCYATDRDQLRVHRSVASTGELYLFTCPFQSSISSLWNPAGYTGWLVLLSGGTIHVQWIFCNYAPYKFVSDVTFRISRHSASTCISSLVTNTWTHCPTSICSSTWPPVICCHSRYSLSPTLLFYLTYVYFFARYYCFFYYLSCLSEAAESDFFRSHFVKRRTFFGLVASLQK